jgi:hypothetical protein
LKGIIQKWPLLKGIIQKVPSVIKGIIQKWPLTVKHTIYVLASIGENLHSTASDLPGGISPNCVRHSNTGWSKFSCGQEK